MFRGHRLRRAHERFLAACRALSGESAYWNQSTSLVRWLLERLCPVPPLSLQDKGRGLLEALEWLETNCRARPVGEAAILHYHRLVYGARKPEAGRYRKHGIAVVGSKIPRARAAMVPALMRELERKLKMDQATFDRAETPDQARILSTAVDLHQRLGLIHPFSDANGRVARLAMNHLLRRYGLGYVIFPPLSEASPLWDALQEAHRGNLQPLTVFAVECMHRV